MQRRWLGDALDFWKGAFLEVLRASSPMVRAVKVIPMFTDEGWTAAEIATYASILGVPTGALISTIQLTKLSRSGYFPARASVDDDIFVDPNTGIAPAKPGLDHVSAAEVFALLTPHNVVAVYQHRPRCVPAPWVGRYAQLIAATDAKVVGYESAQVGMLFATRSEVRLTAVRKALSSRLGAVAGGRGPLPGCLV